MPQLAPHDITVLCLALGILVGVARLFGEIARRFNQPAVLGELLAGIVMGPSVLGKISPESLRYLFPPDGASSLALNAISIVAVTLFLLVAGMEVDLSRISRQGKTAAVVSVAGIVVPFALAFAAAWVAPGAIGRAPGADPLHFALFFATVLSISSLPVIAKTLMDLNLFRSDLGMVIITTAVFDDLVGWLIFAVLLSLVGASMHHGLGVGGTIALTLAYALACLTVLRWLIDRFLPWLQAHTSWPGGVLGFALALAFLGAAFTEWIGIHAIFGSFLIGVALGDSAHLREKTRTIIDQFVSFIFAPIFFASIGLRMDLGANFAPGLWLTVLAIAATGKILGCGLAAIYTGMRGREAWALGFGMNARGAMGIILGLLGLEAGVIDDRMFVALVVMSIATSMISGPAMEHVLKRKKPASVTAALSPKAFVADLGSPEREEAIRRLAEASAPVVGLEPRMVEEAALARERIMSTGIGGGVAVPHARLTGIKAPAVAVGLSKEGVNFDAPDGGQVHAVFLILTSRDDDGAQLEILADIARIFKDGRAREGLPGVTNFTQLVALLRTGA